MHVITYLTTIHFGSGALASLTAAMQELAIRRPLLVSDHGIAATGLLERMKAPLGSDVPTFLDVPTNPTESAVHHALALYGQDNCDGVIAFGGGSPIELAKGVTLLATHSGELVQNLPAFSAASRATPRP
jgi:4-hydroxybutyrate dehydrogenase